MPNSPLIGCRVPRGYIYSHHRRRRRALKERFEFSVPYLLSINHQSTSSSLSYSLHFWQLKWMLTWPSVLAWLSKKDV